MEKQPYYSGKDTIYRTLNEISGQDAMMYLSIMLGSIVVSRFFRVPSNVTIIAMIIAAAFIIVTKSKKDSIGSNFISSNETVLTSPRFKRFPFFYVDQRLLQLVYSIRDWENYAPALYYALKKALNEFLHVYRDLTLPIKLDNAGENFEKAHEYRTTILDLVKGFELSLPSSQYQRHKTVTKTIRTILHAHIERMHKIATDTYTEKGITTRTKFLDMSGITPANQ